MYEGLGFTLVARNWRCPAGELDLVVTRDGLLAFCEVKTRSGAEYGGGYEAVTPAKQRKVRQLAELFLSGVAGAPGRVRFDVVSVQLRPGAPADVQLFDDAF